ncbi:MAG: cupin domain-containing protein [candidate division Zixibacteria bacterium]|nr:cupin domain-containing protein [candidate division Zixibacteria bacterium]
MKQSPINFEDKFAKFSEHFSPKIIAQMNDYHFKLGRFQGDFIWHKHADTDEVFIVLEGAMRIDFRDSSVDLREGEMFVVPKGIEHKPFADKECKIILVEPENTVNTGDSGGDMTAETNVWI